jgi:hypothetical protein
VFIPPRKSEHLLRILGTVRAILVVLTLVWACEHTSRIINAVDSSRYLLTTSERASVRLAFLKCRALMYTDKSDRAVWDFQRHALSQTLRNGAPGMKHV